MAKKMVLNRNQKSNALAASAMSKVSPKNKKKNAAQLRLTYGVVDKLMLVLLRGAFPHEFLNAVIVRLPQAEGVKRISAKGDSYQHVFVLTCPSGTKIVFALLAANDRMRYDLKIVLNPAQMDLPDTKAFYNVLKIAFMPDWKKIMRALLIQRVDQAYDHPVSMADLLVQADGLLAEEKYYVRTDRGGYIQSWYCGSIESLLHYLAYDQVASDAYKVAHGEKPSRPSSYSDAEVVINKKRNAEMVRFEARRVLKTAMTLDEVDQQESPFGRFTIYVLDPERITNGPELFMLYLDSVRLRGVTGAGKQFSVLWPGREGKKRLAEFEAHLVTCIAPWWDKAGLNCSVKYGLQQTVAWNVLKHLTRDE
jgi:hypothetical protein